MRVLVVGLATFPAFPGAPAGKASTSEARTSLRGSPPTVLKSLNAASVRQLGPAGKTETSADISWTNQVPSSTYALPKQA